MLSNKSIADIKQMLVLNQLSTDSIPLLESDARKGVQQLARQLKKQQAQHEQLQQRFMTMNEIENRYREQGCEFIAGLDEVGRGPLAGPVVAAAVILPKDFSLLGLTDSKQLSVHKRNEFAAIIKEQAISVGVGIISHDIIDRINIYQASIKAMEEALKHLTQKPDQLLVDAVPLDHLSYQSEAIIKGDQKSISIAAASVIAKVTRDQLMAQYHEQYPHYDFCNNQGYGTKKHLAGIYKHGITPIHRRTFAPIKEYL
ncbi:RNase HII [Amphibacillus marinus]|uniref:Ribonuclease HII n=1 Tax=Amphibacillus marinus TaxID=872970 RepID=A0A1H8HUP2_9BACI|nr:ribonuclease HII [Amphibacillus marinus]SEN59721.1 RNase HII [Amphibacillus marinus]